METGSISCASPDFEQGQMITKKIMRRSGFRMETLQEQEISFPEKGRMDQVEFVTRNFWFHVPFC